METLILQDTREWAAAIAEMPGSLPLPCRTVVVPNTRVAHGLRRELCRIGKQDVLAGTLFMGTHALAAEVLWAAGVRFKEGEEDLRPLRLREVFAGKLKLEYFKPSLLANTPGWDLAFAAAIDDLESAGLAPTDLTDATDAQARDVGHIWAALDKLPNLVWTQARVFMRATVELAGGARWPLPGPVLAAVTGHESATEAAFLRAIPGATLALRLARPLRDEHLHRIHQLFGIEVAGGSQPPAGKNERDILAAYLFESAETLADPKRPRSQGPDKTESVALEEHAGVEAELEATVDWVAERVLQGTPLEEIAVLTPAADTTIDLAADRLQLLPWCEGALPVFVAGGRAVTSTAAGARVLAVVRALKDHLSMESLAEALPYLRADRTDGGSLSREDALSLIFSLGTRGGSPASPASALEWAARVARCEERQSALLDASNAQSGRQSHEHFRAHHLVTAARGLRAPLEALCNVARLLVENAPLSRLWPTLRDFLDQWVKLPGDGPPPPSHLGQALAHLLDDDLAASLCGQQALAVIEDALHGLRVQSQRFGAPAVYVGTVSSAAGLRFSATCILGLCEGALPSVPREDPVLPDEVRRRLARTAPAATLLAQSQERPVVQLQALDRVVRDTAAALVFSVPRLDSSRTQREFSSVLIEVGAALGRPNRTTGARDRTIPDLAALERDYFEPARESARMARFEALVSASARLDRVAVGVAKGDAHLPASWAEGAHVDLVRLQDFACEVRGPQDGLLGTRAVVPLLPGLSPEKPTSATTLQRLLECPYRYLLIDVLGLEDRQAPPPAGELDVLSFGSLLHSVAQCFFNQHGQAFFAGGTSLTKWREKARAMASQMFDEFLEQYPLGGDSVREQQRRRLLDDVRRLIEHEFEHVGKREFVAAEQPFGYPEPLKIDVGRESLYLHGTIDRLDRQGGRTLVRDLKTGRSHPRTGDEKDPIATRDIQLGLYGLVTRKLAQQWKMPEKAGVAYVYVSGRGEPERAFATDDDFDKLQAATRDWLKVSVGLLHARLFPRSPDADDCKFCPFSVLCGDSTDRATAVLADTGDGPLRAFRELKMGTEDLPEVANED